MIELYKVRHSLPGLSHTRSPVWPAHAMKPAVLWVRDISRRQGDQATQRPCEHLVLAQQGFRAQGCQGVWMGPTRLPKSDMERAD